MYNNSSQQPTANSQQPTANSQQPVDIYYKNLEKKYFQKDNYLMWI
jgi:hypothetical protein